MLGGADERQVDSTIIKYYREVVSGYHMDVAQLSIGILLDLQLHSISYTTGGCPAELLRDLIPITTEKEKKASSKDPAHEISNQVVGEANLQENEEEDPVTKDTNIQEERITDSQIEIPDNEIQLAEITGDPALATPMMTNKIVKRSSRKDLVRPTGESSQSQKPAEKAVRHADISARDDTAVDAEPLRSEKMVTLSDSAPSQKTATSADTTGEHIEADISSPNAQVPIVNLDEEDRRTEEEDDAPSKVLTAVNPEPVRENQPDLGGSAADSAEKTAKTKKRKRDGATVAERVEKKLRAMKEKNVSKQTGDADLQYRPRNKEVPDGDLVTPEAKIQGDNSLSTDQTAAGAAPGATLQRLTLLVTALHLRRRSKGTYRMIILSSVGIRNCQADSPCHYRKTMQATVLGDRSIFLAESLNHAVADGYSFWHFFNT
ncbi:hypothetical protein KSP40_PGU000952 [Platanthera guangdongensis]|uniref:Uncharacterized protein n=1 Tax=Platanthera guangdongensis TaxID=2320717 RepID=A0ABR2LTW4_9ASPA